MSALLYFIQVNYLHVTLPLAANLIAIFICSVFNCLFLVLVFNIAFGLVFTVDIALILNTLIIKSVIFKSDI